MKGLLGSFQNPSGKHFIFLFIFRLINAYLVKTYYAPDEYWQSAEVAHRDVFGYGYLSWEWTRDAPLRSPLYVQLFTILYSILKYTGMDYPFIIAYSPKIIAALQAAGFDYFLLKLAQIYLGQIYVLPTLIFNLTSWYSLFAIPRLLFNVFEMTLFTITLYFFQLAIKQKFQLFDYISRFAAVINFIAKPTSVIPLTFIWPHRLLTMSGSLYDKIKYLFLNIITVIIMIIGSILVDIIYFKKITWTAYNFFEFNFIKSGANLYGVHDMFWYGYQCIPYLLLGFTPFFFLGIYKYYVHQTNKQLSVSLIYYLLYFLFVLSLSAHKEDRFLLPIWAILILMCSYGMVHIGSLFQKYTKWILFFAIFSNLCMFGFMGFHHNRASFTVLDSLRAQGSNVKSVYFFMECHQTPYYSFMHRNIPMDFPDCKPENRVTGSDSLKLFVDPLKYINNVLENQNPSHIVILNHFIRNQTVSESITKHGYKIIEEQGHALFIDSPIGTLDDISLLIMHKKSNKNNSK